MNRILSVAFLLFCTRALWALNYTTSINFDPALLTQAQGKHTVELSAQLYVGESSVSTVSYTLPMDKGLVLMTVTFPDVETALANALGAAPQAVVSVRYSYQNDAGEWEEVARQRVPAVAYATIADSVEKAIGDFEINGNLKAPEVEAKKQVILSATQGEHSPFTVTTLTTPILVGKQLSTQALKVTNQMTLRGEVTLKDKLSGIGIPPVGSIIMTTDKDPPNDNWSLCDGKTLNDAESPLNGKTLPDLMTGRFPRATGDLSKVGQTGGNSEGKITLTTKHLPAHTHAYSTVDPEHRNVGFVSTSEDDTGGGDWINHQEDHAETQKPDISATSLSKGGGQPLTLLPPFVVYYFHIRIK